MRIKFTTMSVPRLRVLGCVSLATLLLSFPAQAPGQDAGKAINLLQNLLRPQAAPAAPAKPGVPGVLGNALTVAPLGAAPGNAATAIDLVGLLSQSLEQIDQPKEIEIGRQLAAVLLGSKPLHPDLALQRYVNQLGRWISLQSARPDLPWTFGVLNDPGYNAFAAPGGYIFVTKGLIDRTADESELAAILAHEIIHVVQKHHLKALRKTARSGILTQVLAAHLSKEIGAGLSSQLVGLGRDIYSKGLDQADEYEADREGVVLAASAGFDPYGLVAVLQQLRSATPDNPAFTLTLSTHPSAQVRLEQMELAMGNRLDALTGKPALTVAQRMTQLATGKKP